MGDTLAGLQMHEINVTFDDPRNSLVCDWLKKRAPYRAMPSGWTNTPGVHPDVLDWFWRAEKQLPKRCAWVVYGAATFVHPDSGIVFAFLKGMMVALRVEDPPASAESIDGLESNWQWINGSVEKEVILRAYQFAGKLVE